MGQTAVLADEVVEVPETEEQSEVIAEDTRETEEVQMSAGAAEEMPDLRAAVPIEFTWNSYFDIEPTRIGYNDNDGSYANTEAEFCYDAATKTLILKDVNLIAKEKFRVNNFADTSLNIFFLGECELNVKSTGPLLTTAGSTSGRIKLIGADKDSSLSISGGTGIISIGDKVELEYYGGQVKLGKFTQDAGETAKLYMGTGAAACTVKVDGSAYTGDYPITAANSVEITPSAEQADTAYKVELTDTDGKVEDGKIKLNIDSKCQLKATVTGTSNQDVVYMSSNPKIARVDPHTGEVTGVEKGKATITVRARADLRKSASIDVNVGKFYDFTFRSGIDGVPDKVIQLEDGQKFKFPDDAEVVSWNEAYKTKTDEYKLVEWFEDGTIRGYNPGDEITVGENLTFKAEWGKYVTVTFKKDIRNTASREIVVSANEKKYYKGQNFDLMKIEERFPEILTDDSEPYHKFYLTKFLGWYDSLYKYVFDPSRDGAGQAWHYDKDKKVVEETVKEPGTDRDIEVHFRSYSIDKSEANDTVNFFGLWDIPEDDPIYSDPSDTPSDDSSDDSKDDKKDDPSSPSNNTPGGSGSTSANTPAHKKAEGTCVKGEKVDVHSVYFSGISGIGGYRIDSGGSGKGSVNGKGIFKGKKPGTVIVLAQDGKGKSAKVIDSTVITVLEKPKLKFSGSYAAGQTFDAYDCFTTSSTKETAADSWESSKTLVATVDSQTGMITIVGKGKTKITAKFGNVKVKAKLKVK